MDGSTENIQFSWGRKIGMGGRNKDVPIYDSFTFDNVKYSLYDCVYLYKDDEPEPYVGKIIRIFQKNQAKKVKILWFFFPHEIRNYVGAPVEENEIFLASGEGTGLWNINPLEAIAGKCTVVCISKDERNRQPTPREQVMAEYIYYRFFDVGSCIISDQLPEKIAGLEVNVLLNPEDEQVTSCPDKELVQMDPKVDEGLVAAVPLPKSAVNVEDERLAVKKKDERLAVKKKDGSSSVKKKDESSAFEKFESLAFHEGESPVAAFPLSQSVVRNEDEFEVAAIPLAPATEDNVHKPAQNVPKRTQKVLSREIASNKLKPSQDPTVHTAELDFLDETDHPGPVKARQPGDKRKWFFEMTWKEKVQAADRQERLVYIQNLDVQFAPSDIKELIHEALQLSCDAMLINHPTYDDPNNGKAYAVFNTKGDADTAVSKINSGLVVGGRPLFCSKGLLKVPKTSGSLVGHLTITNKKKSHSQREEQKKAVSTSHCCQPNTIEYELALNWMLARETQENKFSVLWKKHMEQRKAFAERLMPEYK